MDEDVLRAEEEIVDRHEPYPCPLEADIGVHAIGETIEPLPFPLILVIEEFYALHRPQAFDEVRRFIRLCLDHALAQVAEVAEQRDSDHGVAEENTQHDERKLGAVGEHHGERYDRHRPIDDREDQALADEIANRLDRGETRKHVADMPLLEERKRKPDEVAEQPRAKGEVERVLQDHDNQRPEPGDGDGEHRDEGKTERQHDEQVDIAPRDDFVHRKLQIEGARDHDAYSPQRR